MTAVGARQIAGDRQQAGYDAELWRSSFPSRRRWPATIKRAGGWRPGGSPDQPRSMDWLRSVSTDWEILPVRAFAEARDQALELGDVDEAEVEGDFFRAADLEPLALLERPHEARRVDQRVGRSGVEPGEAASHALDVERRRLRDRRG